MPRSTLLNSGRETVLLWVFWATRIRWTRLVLLPRHHAVVRERYRPASTRGKCMPG